MGTGINKNISACSNLLRRQAEEQLLTKSAEVNLPRTEDDSKRLVHELEVHQIELEMQNAELRQARNELETALDKFTDLYDFAPVGYLSLDRSGVICSINHAGARLLAGERSRLLGQRFAMFICDHISPSFPDFLESVFAGTEKKGGEFALVNKKGGSQTIQIEAKALESHDECRMAVIDITDRKRAEDQVKESEQKYRLLFENMAEGFAVYELLYDDQKNPVDWRLLEMNAAYSQHTGLNRTELLGRRMSELFPAAIPEFLPRFAGVVATQKAIEFETYASVTERYNHVVCFPAGPNRFANTFVDITARKLAEEELQRIHNSLEDRITERTVELRSTNERLVHEVDERLKAEASVLAAYTEIHQLKNRLQAENIYLQQEVARNHNFGEIVGNSSALSSIFTRIKQVAPMNATVLLHGETGTGKGVVARAIHSRSTRKDRPMITVNCTSLPANLVESELFGREKGAFTGAHDRQIGRFELANNGTIFLDEIGEMPMELQCKLLRVIQDGEFERLGSPRTIKVDVRIIAASNRNLVDEIRKGTFREDLFYRLNVFPITIPPLRERKEDIPLLVNHFVAKFNKKNGTRIESASKETMDALQAYNWPGNVRELESIIERAVITSQGKYLQILDRFTTFRKPDVQAEDNIKALAELEHDHILEVLTKTSWRIEGDKGAALLLGINPSTLRARMRKLGIVCHRGSV